MASNASAAMTSIEKMKAMASFKLGEKRASDVSTIISASSAMKPSTATGTAVKPPTPVLQQDKSGMGMPPHFTSSAVQPTFSSAATASTSTSVKIKQESPSPDHASSSSRGVMPGAVKPVQSADGPSLKGTPDQLRDAIALSRNFKGLDTSRKVLPNHSVRRQNFGLGTTSCTFGVDRAPLPGPSPSKPVSQSSVRPFSLGENKNPSKPAAVDPSKIEMVVKPSSGYKPIDITKSPVKKAHVSPHRRPQVNTAFASASPGEKLGVGTHAPFPAPTMATTKPASVSSSANSVAAAKAGSTPSNKITFGEIKQDSSSSPAAPSMAVKPASVPASAVSTSNVQQDAETKVFDFGYGKQESTLSSLSQVLPTSGAAEPSLGASKTLPAVEIDEMAMLKKQIGSLTAEVSKLKIGHRELSSKVELMVKRDEKRAILGTDNASFHVMVKCPGGRNIQIQVVPEMTVGDLIRAVREKGNIRPAHSPKPVIAVNDKQVGHVQTLGEIDMSEVSKVELIYDDSNEEL